MRNIKHSLWRLWQPGKPLFWLVLAFNLLSSAMAWALHLWSPSGVLLWLLTLLALANTGMGWWLLWRLWQDGAAQTPLTHFSGDTHVQSPADPANPRDR